jgi:hypothetical protein
MRLRGIYILMITLLSLTAHSARAEGESTGPSNSGTGKGTIGLVCRTAEGAVLSAEVLYGAQYFLPDDLLWRTHNAFERNLDAQYCGVENLPTDILSPPADGAAVVVGPGPAEKDPGQHSPN